MLDTRELVQEACRMLEPLADPKRTEQAKTICPTAMRVMGVKGPDIRGGVREMAKRVKKTSAIEVTEFARLLVATDVFECRQMAYEVLSRHKGAMAALGPRSLEVLGRGNDNWASVDAFATLVAGPAWREERVPDEVVRGWAQSEDRWWRRTAVVCTVALNLKARGGTGDAPRTLDICRLVISDKDDMVAKALSWALRELSRREPALVREFIEEHEDVLPARVKREVRRKIETGRKYERKAATS